jgi:hypothetical protein
MHMTADYANHDMLSFYPIDMVIFYHSKTGYTVERRRHKINDISNIYQAAIYDTAKLAGV